MADVALLLRSPLLAEILQAILLDGGEWTADELSAVTEAPYATVTKELRRLERAGVLAVRTAGRTRYVSSAAGDPAIRAIARALAASEPSEGGDPMAKKKSKKKGDKKKKKK